MAFDPNSIPKDLRQLNIVRTVADEVHIAPGTTSGRPNEGFHANPPREIGSPGSVSMVYYPALVSDSGFAGVGSSNAVAARGVAGWVPHVAHPVPPQPGYVHAGFVDSGSGISPSQSSGTRSHASHQASDDSGDRSGTKVKFMCSFGGKILPRPSDGALRYVGGQTRIISVRRDASYNELVCKMVEIYGESVVIKYQLPEEDLDALVTVSCPDDLENMMDEYEKLAERFSDGSAKLRLFLFSPSEADLASVVQLSDMQNSGQKYYEAVNGILDGLGVIGITRRASTASATSVQNSDVSGVDGHGEVNGLPSTGGLSPKEISVASQEVTPRTVCVDQNPAIGNDTSVTPLGISMAMSGPLPAVPIQQEHEIDRPTPVIIPQQMGYDMQQPGTALPTTSHYMQAFVDPHHENSNAANYAQPPSQRGFPMQVLGAVSPGLQHQHVAAAGTPQQQFIPAIHMGIPPPSHVSMNPNMVPAYFQPQHMRVEHFPAENTYGQRFVHLPINQAYSSYQAQVPPAVINGGYGWHQVPHQEQVTFSEGWLPNQQLLSPEKTPIFENCNMCQKALPHAHSDTLAQEHKESSASNFSDPKLVHYSLQLGERGRPMNINFVNGAQGEASVEQHGIGVSSQVHMEPEVGKMQNSVGIPQNIEGQYSGDRFVPREGEYSEQPQQPQQPQSPFGVLVGTVPRSYQDNSVKPVVVPTQYQVRHDPLMNIPASGNLPTVRGSPLQTSDYRVHESPRDFSNNSPSMVPKEDSQESSAAYDHLRPIDGRTENLHPAEVLLNHEHRPIGNLKREEILEYKQLTVGERETYLDSTVTSTQKFQDANQIKPNEMLPCSANVSSYLHNLRQVGVNNLVPDEFSSGITPFSDIGTAHATERAQIGDRKDNDPFQSKIVRSDVVVVPSEKNAASSQSPPYKVVDAQDGLNSLFSNQDPWNIHQETHFPPPKPKQIQLKKDPLDTREPSGNIPTRYGGEFITDAWLEECVYQTSGNLNADFNSEHTQSSKGSAEELIKQELKAVAEGVASSVLQSSPPSHPDLSAHGKSESPSMSQENIEVQKTDLEIEHKDQFEEIKANLPEKINMGFPLSEGIGRLQIIKNSDLEELRELGSGTFGTVYHGKWRGTDVAIKRINDRCFAGKPSEEDRMREDFWNEAIKLADLHHPNVVAFYGVVLDGLGGSIATVTEYMVNGSLKTALQKSERNLDMRKRLLIAMDVAFGMEYLHGKNIVHFDLKSDNLLVNLRDPHRPICKVGDLGLSKVKCQTLISGGVRGTLPWMAPELLNGSSSLVSEKVDVYSFGIVMWEILTGEEPYADLHYGAIIGGIVSNTLRPPIPESCDPEWKLLMERCWSSEPSERPSFTEIANDLRAMASKLPTKGNSP